MDEQNYVLDRRVFIVWIGGEPPHLCWNRRAWVLEKTGYMIWWPGGATTTFHQSMPLLGRATIVEIGVSTDAWVAQVVAMAREHGQEVPYDDRVERARLLTTAPAVNQQDVPVRVPEREAECPPE